MHTTIKPFRDHYADQMATGMSEFLTTRGRILVKRIQSAVSDTRSTIYLFGNGGSHAISKCMEYALQAYASRQGVRIRVRTGVDIHKATLLANNGQSGTSFVDVLKTEGADSKDFIILISGSGNSGNLCEVASYAVANSIPVVALLGSGGGRLSNFIAKSDCFSVPLVDQQISEDIIQSLACVIDEPISETDEVTWNEMVQTRSRELRNAIDEIPISFIADAAEAITATFFSRKFTWVLGFDHPALSVCAEHVAHNLYWDGIYEVADPPQRLIFSSPTACDFSGISNDRRRGIVEILTGLSDIKGQGVAVLSSMTASQPALLSLLDRLQQAAVPVFLLFGEGQMEQEGDLLRAHQTRLKRPQLQALAAQILGHMLGRLVRLKLIEQRGSDRLFDLSNPSRFLVEFDLAQRRLLDV